MGLKFPAGSLESQLLLARMGQGENTGLQWPSLGSLRAEAPRGYEGGWLAWTGFFGTLS